MDLKSVSAKRKSKALRIICISSVVVLILFAIILFMLTRTPAHYQPAKPQNTNEVSQYLTNYLAPEIHNKSQIDEPFEVLIAQQGLNDIIARGPWPVKLNGLTIFDPAVVLSPDRIMLMATVKYARLPVVVTVAMSPHLDEARLLHLNLRSVKAGSANITSLAKELAEKIVTVHLGKVDSNAWADDISAALLQNKSFDPVFTAYDRQIRLTRIDISDTKALLRFTPQVNH